MKKRGGNGEKKEGKYRQSKNETLQEQEAIDIDSLNYTSDEQCMLMCAQKGTNTSTVLYQ